MTWKEFKKRVTEILTDTNSGFSTDEEREKWKNRQKERAELDAERKRHERLLLDTWFEQERYIKGSWWKRICLSLVYLAKDTRGEGKLPDFVAKDIARCLLPNILAYFESEEGKKHFTHGWKRKTHRKTKSCSQTSKRTGLKPRPSLFQAFSVSKFI